MLDYYLKKAVFLHIDIKKYFLWKHYSKNASLIEKHKNNMLINDKEYFSVLEEIKARIKTAQHKAVLGANRELINLNWNIGRIIIANTKYGAKFTENLAIDIKQAFPNVTGYSARNLKYMRKFAEVVNDEEKVQTVSALLSWSHNTHLLDKTISYSEYLWYAEQAIENGWSLSSLEYHTETKTYQRQAIVEKTSNYLEKSPSVLGKLAEETLKDL